MKPTIESWAQKFLSVYHPKSELDFNKNVSKIEFCNCFTLKVLDANGKVADYYFISSETSKVSEESQPFHNKLSKFFQPAVDGIVPRLWIGYILVDSDRQPLDAQRFKVDPKQVD